MALFFVGRNLKLCLRRFVLIKTEATKFVIGRAIGVAIIINAFCAGAAAFIMGYIFSELFIETCAAGTNGVHRNPASGAAFAITAIIG